MLRTLRTLLPVVLLAAAVGVPASALAAAPAGGLLPTAAIEATIGACRITGSTRPNTTFRLTHKTVSGRVKSKAQITSNGFGDWQRGCPGPKVAPRDRLELRLLGDATIFKALTIPVLTLVTDRVHDKVRGTAKGVATVGLGLSTCDPGHGFCGKVTGADVPVNPSTHAFTWTVPSDTTGLSRINLTWAKGDDSVSLDQDFAHVVVRLGSAGVVVTGPRGSAVERASLKHGTTVSSVSRRTNGSATFGGTLKRNGSPTKARVGDTVTSSVASDVNLKVPALTAEATVGGVAGTCFKSRAFTVALLGADGSVQAGASGITDVDGSWELLTSISAGWSLKVWCANAAGDIVRITKVLN